MRVLQERLQNAVRLGKLSRPQRVLEDLKCPVYSAICFVDLPQGTLPPPNGAPHRVALGHGRTHRDAGSLAMLEAVERYSIQHRSSLAARIFPFLARNGRAEEIATAELTLGVPGGPETTSIGAAAGENREAAAIRAVLELLEHRHVAEI